MFVYMHIIEFAITPRHVSPWPSGASLRYVEAYVIVFRQGQVVRRYQVSNCFWVAFLNGYETIGCALDLIMVT